MIEDGEVVLGVLGCPNYPADWRETETERGFLFIAVNGQEP
jgi:3'(2'), 5'-bisphosphate nucleotidase